jgi:hypothetical protein
MTRESHFQPARSLLATTIWLLLLFSAGLNHAQTPSATAIPKLIRFGGSARDLNGKPFNGVVVITFSLYSEQTGGAPLWMETQNVQADANGHYSVLLGATMADGLPAEIFASEQARWIGVQVEQQAELPRVLLVSAPYALKAGDAETLGGLPPSAFARSVSPSAGDGASATGNSPTPSHATMASPLASLDVTTTGGTAHTIPIFTTATNIQNSIVTQTGTSTVNVKGKLSATGNVTSSALVSGGTVSSDGAVNVAGDLREDINGKNKGGSGGYTPGIRFGIGNTGEAVASDRAGTVNQNGLDFYTDFTSRMSITNGGPVGVGTETPQAWFEVDSQAFEDATHIDGWNAPSGSNTSGGFGLIASGGNSDPIGNSGTGGTAIIGTGGDGVGVPSFDGVGGVFTGGNTSFNGDGVDGNAGSGYAGNFTGDVVATGTFTGGEIVMRIDDPLDPANKFLVHSSLESSEMKNLYDGVVITDGQGEARVELPKWFEALNTDFRYQLTVIGQFAQAVVAREIQNHAFAIRTNLPNVKVSWQVTGVRQDAYAKSHPMVVEQVKEAPLRGFYIHPELHGAPAERQIEWARHPQLMRKFEQDQRARNAAPAGAVAKH